MRVGVNPQKYNTEISHDFFHQVVIPVYIPNDEDYFIDSLSILKLCLESLFLTCHDRTYFTVVNNGSHREIIEYLNDLLHDNKIHEVIHTHNMGKVNGISKGIMGHAFPLITITDADVIFLNDWQQASYAIFEEFPKTGFVSTTPMPKLLKYHTQEVLFDFGFSKRLMFQKPKNPEALVHFAKSIGNTDLINNSHLTNILTIKGKLTNAVLGCGHFVATFKGDVFDGLKEKYADQKLGGDSVRKFLDQPVADKGYWRLATEDNYTYHMGNIKEKWMTELLQTLDNKGNIVLECPKLSELDRVGWITRFKIFIVNKIVFRQPLWRFYMRSKGLSKEASKEY
jgi:Glycosyl transferase family 2